MQDLIIENGHVIDWFSNTDTITDISVKDGVITAIGKATESAKQRIDASGYLVIPGIIDSHMHASSWLAGRKSYKMLALAGVTTALEMAGPLEDVKKGLLEDGTGITVGCLEMIRPGWNVQSSSVQTSELIQVIRTALAQGAFGVKLLGGHYPLTPESSAELIRLCDDGGIYLGVHAGSTQQGSNIKGVKEIVDCADGHAFHLAHTNAYCRGNITDVPQEIAFVEKILQSHPEIDSESYLSPINGCSGYCVDGIPESRITRNCLRTHGYEVTQQGLYQAIKDGFARVHFQNEDSVELADCAVGLSLWLEHNTNVSISFSVNPALSNFYFATQKRTNGKFLSDSFCTDGGGIPRNVIIENGLSLVKFGAISLKEFVFKSSTSAANLLGLPQKGRLVVGADADITVVDYDKQKAVHAFSMGKPTLLFNKVVGSKGTLLTTPDGKKAAIEAGLNARVADMQALFDYRLNRFN